MEHALERSLGLVVGLQSLVSGGNSLRQTEAGR